MQQPHSDSDSDDQIYPQQTKEQQPVLDYDQVLETEIMGLYEKEERELSKQNQLSEDVQFKLEEVLEEIAQADQKDYQTMIGLRMKELAYTKILVMTYEKNYFRLVQALTHIAKQYLKFGCYEQAVTHLQNAISKNVRAGETTQNKLYHSYLLTFLADAYYHLKKYSQALIEIEKALNIQDTCQSKLGKYIDNTKGYIIIAKTKLKLNQPSEAIEYIKTAIQRCKEIKNNQANQTLGLAVYEYAKMQNELKHPREALNLYKQALIVIEQSNHQDFQQQLIKIHTQMSQIYESLQEKNAHIQSLQAKYQVFEDTYGNSDKRSIKQQRILSQYLIKYRQLDDAIELLQEILEKQQKVYGDNSVEVGKQFRNIANTHLLRNDLKQSEINLKKALKIFHDLGDQKLAREVRMKLTALQQH